MLRMLTVSRTRDIIVAPKNSSYYINRLWRGRKEQHKYQQNRSEEDVNLNPNIMIVDGVMARIRRGRGCWESRAREVLPDGILN